MSHFTQLKTQMTEAGALERALNDLGYQVQRGDVEIRGYRGNKTPVEMKIATSNASYDIGFRKVGDAYEMVADWGMIKNIDQNQFLRQLSQRYAYHVTHAKLAEQGFSVVEEKVSEGGQIHLVLRRTV